MQNEMKEVLAESNSTRAIDLAQLFACRLQLLLCVNLASQAKMKIVNYFDIFCHLFGLLTLAFRSQSQQYYECTLRDGAAMCTKMAEYPCPSASEAGFQADAILLLQLLKPSLHWQTLPNFCLQTPSLQKSG